MQSRLILLAAGLAALLAVSCAPATPEARIQKNPEMFEALPANHQAQVREGRIDRGMSQEAVYLAWGRPAAVAEVVRDRSTAERWDYAGSQPVFVNNFHGAYGWGRRGWGPAYGFGWGPDVIHVPYRRASVWFIERRVDSWESIR